MNEGINVLSLFDGCSGLQQALERLGIKVNMYLASEIKPHAIKVTQHNFPNTIQLGDVTKIDICNLPKIHLLAFGSPCQDFSRGNAIREGLKGLKSSLFYRALEILEYVNPDYFLMENVIMEEKFYNEISHKLKTFPVSINSELVSAQLRDRLYWTNIGPEKFDLFGMRYCNIPQPKDKKIYLQSILESGYTDRYKSRALLESDSRPLKTQSKMWHRYNSTGFTTIVYEDESLDWEKGIRYLSQIELERLQTVKEGYTSILKRNDAACLLGDGWTIDVICHILQYLPHGFRKKI